MSTDGRSPACDLEFIIENTTETTKYCNINIIKILIIIINAKRMSVRHTPYGINFEIEKYS